MPYKTLTDLPDSVRDALPKHAQHIYLEAFNHAWDEYKDPQKRKTESTREEVSHKVAWTAVKKSYIKKGGTWSERQKR